MNRPTRHPTLWSLSRPLGDLAAAAGAFFAAFLARIAVPLPWTKALLPPSRLELATAR